MKGGAILSDDGQYRYVLTREWGDCEIKCPVTFVMLNPSTASATENDATVRKCIGFAKRWGYDAIIIVNLFAYRSRFPHHLRDVSDPVGHEAKKWLKWGLKRSTMIIPAWGRNGDKYPARVAKVMKQIEKHNGRAQVKCLGWTADGSPKHPLMPAYDTELEDFFATYPSGVR